MLPCALFALGIAALALLSDCQPKIQAHYDTAIDAQREGAFTRGTLPTLLFPDTTDIDEMHDFSIEHSGARFHFEDTFRQRLSSGCRPYSAEERVESPFVSWPEFVDHHQTSAQLQEEGFETYHCGPVTVAVDKNGSGYLWR